VPPKVRELIAELQNGGFADRGGKGSHQNFVHPKVAKPITYRVPLATMPSITRFDLYAER
jgi:predicted RNA binding protein YcfA (HicA-like mRNA interferase family)